MVIEWGDLKVGVRVSDHPDWSGRLVQGQGKLWHEHHVVDRIATSGGSFVPFTPGVARTPDSPNSTGTNRG